jgi:hypothetical protein
MGLAIRLKSEGGRIVGEVLDPKNLLSRVLPEADDEAYACLRFIDRYGDTVFNRLQMPTLLGELKRIEPLAQDPELRQLLSEVEQLALRCEKEVHWYLWFIGD